MDGSHIFFIQHLWMMWIISVHSWIVWPRCLVLNYKKNGKIDSVCPKGWEWNFISRIIFCFTSNKTMILYILSKMGIYLAINGKKTNKITKPKLWKKRWKHFLFLNISVYGKNLIIIISIKNSGHVRVKL